MNFLFCNFQTHGIKQNIRNKLLKHMYIKKQRLNHRLYWHLPKNSYATLNTFIHTICTYKASLKYCPGGGIHQGNNLKHTFIIYEIYTPGNAYVPGIIFRHHVKLVYGHLIQFGGHPITSSIRLGLLNFPCPSKLNGIHTFASTIMNAHLTS